MALITNPAPASITGPQGQATYSETQFALNVLLSTGYTAVSRPCNVATAVGIQQRGAIGHYDAPSQNFTVPAAGQEATCNAILAQYTDPTLGTVASVVYVSGKFRTDGVVFPPGASKALVDDALRNYAIELEAVQGTTGQNIDPHEVPLSQMSAEQLRAEAKRLAEETKRLEAESKALADEAERRQEESKLTGAEAQKAESEAKKAEAAEAKLKADNAKHETKVVATDESHHPHTEHNPTHGSEKGKR